MHGNRLELDIREADWMVHGYNAVRVLWRNYRNTGFSVLMVIGRLRLVHIWRDPAEDVMFRQPKGGSPGKRRSV